MKYYMEWREDFDDQHGWFSKFELKKEIKRIQKMIDNEEYGEVHIYKIIKGKDVTEQFYKGSL